MTTLTSAQIKERSSAFDLSSVLRLDLSAMELGALASMEEVVNLEELSVFGNQLTTLEGLARCLKLRRLDAAHNALRSAAPLEDLRELEMLELQGNRIAAVADLGALARLPQLRTLRLQDDVGSGADGGVGGGAWSNPVCGTPSYFEDVCKLLPQLAVLDGESIELKKSMLLAAQLRAEAGEDDADASGDLPPSRPWCDGAGFSWETGAAPVESSQEAVREAAKGLKVALVGCGALTDRADDLLAGK